MGKYRRGAVVGQLVRIDDYGHYENGRRCAMMIGWVMLASVCLGAVSAAIVGVTVMVVFNR